MVLKYEDLSSCVDRLKAFIPSKSLDSASVLIEIDIESSKIMFAFTDGRRAISTRKDAHFNEQEQSLCGIGGIIVPFKNLLEIASICKPAGVLRVDYMSMCIDNERNIIRISAEKYIEQESETDGTEQNNNVADGGLFDAMNIYSEGVDNESVRYERRVISVIKQSFSYIRAADDRRRAILTRVDYGEMLSCYSEHVDNSTDEFDSSSSTNQNIGNANEIRYGDVWDKSEFIGVLSIMSAEQKNYTIFSGKTHSVAVSNINYAVYEQRNEVKNSLCIQNDIAKNIIDVFNRSGGDNLVVYSDGTFCTICNDTEDTAVWFESKRPMKMALQVISGYTQREYNTFRIVALKDAMVNIVKCCRQATDRTTTKLKFSVDCEGNVSMAFDGLNSTSKENDFSLSIEEVKGDLQKLVNTQYEISFEQLENMINVCSSTFIGIYVNDAGQEKLPENFTDGDSSTTVISSQPILNIIELFQEGGSIIEGRKAYTMLRDASTGKAV